MLEEKETSTDTNQTVKDVSVGDGITVDRLTCSWDEVRVRYEKVGAIIKQSMSFTMSCII